MAQSVKLGEEVMTLVRREADLQSRSIAGQISHWIKLGRAIERSGSFDHAKITAALAGQLDTTELTEQENEVWLDQFTSALTQPDAGERSVHARRQELGKGVGLDAGGNLVYADAVSELAGKTASGSSKASKSGTDPAQ